VPENKSSPGDDALVIAVILGRVLIMLLLWLGIFAAIFLGYFTVPILLIGVVIAIYMISDLGLFVRLKQRRKLADERQKLIESLEDNPGKDE
jgi:membrane protein implicated in regulation of membrane protease activity